MDTRTPNQKAWWLVLPVVVLVAFNAVIPLMTVVNYSVQETFGENVFLWSGVRWFEEVLNSERFHDALMRSILFTFLVLVIEVPLAIFMITGALRMLRVTMMRLRRMDSEMSLWHLPLFP